MYVIDFGLSKYIGPPPGAEEPRRTSAISVPALRSDSHLNLLRTVSPTWSPLAVPATGSSRPPSLSLHGTHGLPPLLRGPRPMPPSPSTCSSMCPGRRAALDVWLGHA